MILSYFHRAHQEDSEYTSSEVQRLLFDRLELVMIDDRSGELKLALAEALRWLDFLGQLDGKGTRSSSDLKSVQYVSIQDSQPCSNIEIWTL